jgi:hypothetical protein
MKTAKLISLFFVCNLAFSVELIQVDVGNAIDFSGPLIMKKTEKVNECNHGTDMASALNDELIKQKSKPVIAKQIVWDLDYNPRKSVLTALLEAYKEEPKVLSLSFGGRNYDPTEEAYIAANTLNDTVVVAAAGNDGGGTTYYPANYKNKCILSVGTSFKGNKADFSNNGAVWLEYNPKDARGTSASTARMAAIVLQIRRQNPSFKCADVVLTMKMLYGRIQK